MFRIGDLVIKKEGGNKMIITEIMKDGLYSCIWATDKVHSGDFKEEDIVKLTAWYTWIHQMERNDKIDEVLKSD